MAVVKNEIPILEFDSEAQAVIMPGHGWDYKFSPKTVMLWILWQMLISIMKEIGVMNIFLML